MRSDLSASAQKVQDFLTTIGVDCKVVEVPNTTRTAQEAAQAIGCDVAQIAKSLVFKTRRSGRPILVIASGFNRVNEKRLAELLQEPVDRPDAEFVRARTGYAIGGIPPAGHAEVITTFLDEDLKSYEFIWAAAGTPFAVFKLIPSQLEQITAGKWIKVK